MKILLFLITALMLTFNANAQSDYVITVKGDSIPCRVRFSLGGTSKYKTDTMRKFKKINSDEMTEFYIADKSALYRAVYIDNDKRPSFLLAIEKGKISLYQIMNTVSSPYGSTTTTTWYIGKGSDYVKEFKFNGIGLKNSRAERKAEFAKLLIDNKSVYDKFIAEDKFSFKQIKNIVHLYDTGEPAKDK